MATVAHTAPSVVHHQLAQPDPLVNLIDFGNLHKVLAYILDNLRATTDRLTKLESNVLNLNTITANQGDALATLRTLLMNLKPGGSEADLEELKERVNVVSGRVDNQTKEIGALAAQGREHQGQLEVLESSTQVLQSLMPTKADVSDLLTKANKTVTDRHEKEIVDLQATAQEHDARLKALEQGLKRLGASIDALVNDGFKEEALRRITELENQLLGLTAVVNAHSGHLDLLDTGLATKAEKEFVDRELDALHQKLRELELALANSMKGELKRFERDVMLYVADQLTSQAGGAANAGAQSASASSHSHSHGTMNTAAGKLHYRCLTCDQPRAEVPGAQTFRYNKSASGGGSSNSANALAASDSRLLEMQLGDQIYLHGTDGGIYRGRADPAGTLALPGGSSPPSDVLRLTAAGGQTTARGSSPDRRRPSSASSGGGGAQSARPQSADPSQTRFGHNRLQIDPQSGRKSAEIAHLPLTGLTDHAGGGGFASESKEQEYSAQRTLFPSPSKSSHRMLSGFGSAGNGGNSTSRAAIQSGGGSQGLLHSGSQSHLDQLQQRGVAGSPTGALGLAAQGVKKVVRPSTATARSSSSSSYASGGETILVGRPKGGDATDAAGRTSVTRNGVQIVQEPDQ